MGGIGSVVGMSDCLSAVLLDIMARHGERALRVAEK